MIEREREWGGTRYAVVIGELTMWRRLEATRRRGRHRGGAGARRGPDGSQGGSQQGIEERVRGPENSTDEWQCEMVVAK
jgi:hypothetical protein